MTLMSLRSKTSHDTPLMRSVRNHPVRLPGYTEPWTVGAIFAKAAKSRKFWSQVKLMEVSFPTAATSTPPAAVTMPAAAATPTPPARGASYQIAIAELRAQRDAIDQAIAILEALS